MLRLPDPSLGDLRFALNQAFSYVSERGHCYSDSPSADLHQGRLHVLVEPALAYEGSDEGSAAREWLSEREAELLPVPYLHCVFSLPAEIADIAYTNEAVIYDLLLKISAEVMTTIAANPFILVRCIHAHLS